MKSNKTLFRALAILMVLAFSASILGCISSYNTNPVIAKVGSVDLDLSQFYSLYNNTDTSSNPYYYYLQYGAISKEQYGRYIIEDLVNYGVQLDQIKVQNITLDEAEEAEVQEKVENNISEYAVKNYGDKVDAAITDEAEKTAAAIELLKKDLQSSGTNFDSYRNGIEESLRNSALVSKLRDVTIGEVTVTNDDVKAYIESQIPTAANNTATNFRNNFQNFITATSQTVPLLMPHPEKAVEDDPDTEADETKAADPYGEIFSVQHLLMKFATEASTEESYDLPAYAAKDNVFENEMNEFEELIPTLTTEQFLEKCHDAEICDDPGMQQPAYMYFGYVMQKDLLSDYYEGFGLASMKLKYGEDWEPEKEAKEATETESTETVQEKDHGITFFTLADGAKIVKVYTTSGAHYIILNPNDCFSMYDEDGYFMLPLYDGDQVVTDAEGIVTANGHMTQEQFDAVNEILKNVKEATTTTDENTASKDDDTEEETEEKIVDLKSLYDYYNGQKKSSLESDKYTEIFQGWKDSTNITVYENILAPFLRG